MRTPVLICLLLLSSVQGANTQASCLTESELLRSAANPFRAEEGVRDAERATDKREFYRLHPDHSVYRVRDLKSGRSYVLKLYPSADALANDLAGLKLLRSNPAFGIARVSKRSGQNTMILEDVRGRSVKALLNDPSVPPATLKTVIDEYSRKVKELERFLRDSYEIETLRTVEMGDKLPAFMARVVEPGKRESIKIWIKPDQVIVRETSRGDRLEMVLIDPY